MGVPTSEVGYSIATTRRETTKVHKNMWWQWRRNKNSWLDLGFCHDSFCLIYLTLFYYILKYSFTFNPTHWITPKTFLIKPYCYYFVFRNNNYHCFIKITNLHHYLLIAASSIFTPFVNRCLPEDGRRRLPKHVAVLNKNQCIRSVWLCLSVNITLY